MGKLADYAEQAKEVERLVLNDGYSVVEALKIVRKEVEKLKRKEE